jgi:hypothetical protein
MAASVAGAALLVGQTGAATSVASTLPAYPGQTRSSTNYQLNTDPNVVRGKDAPGLAVDPSNPQHVVEVQLDLINFECQYNVSFDGGTTWTGGNLKAPAGYPQTSPCTVLGHGANAIDAGVRWGTGQNVYVAWASAIGQGSTAALVSKSTDGGQTFATAVVAIPGDPSPTGNDNEYPKLAVLPGGGTGGADLVTVVADSTSSTGDHSISGTVYAAVSKDSAATWSGPVQVNQGFTTNNPYGAIEHTQPVFAPDGTLYVGWRTSQPGTVAATDPSFPTGFIQVAKSTDGGLTWGNYVNATNVKGFVYTGPPAPPFGPTGNQYCCSSFPRLAVDPNNGTLYLVWSQDAHLYEAPGADVVAQDHFMIQRSQVWFMRSTDGGTTWTDRKQISEDPGVATTDLPSDPANPETQTRHPNVSVAPDGRVDIVWQDRRHSYRACSQTHVACDEVRLGDTYYSYSLDGGTTFTANRRITDRSMNNDVGFDYRFSTYWNFGPVAASVGKGKLLFAWQDSRLGNYDTDTQDIFLAKTNLNAQTAVPVVSNGTHPAYGMSVALSQKADPGGSESRLAGVFASQEATKVVIANQNDVANALAGGVLARANVGPLLLSPATGLPLVVKKEVARMTPIGAYILGNTTQLSNQIQADLVAAGVPSGNIVRIGGTGAADMAAQIAMTLDRRTATDKTAMAPAFDAAIIANPNSPDAVAASDLAAAKRLPILYVDRDTIPSQTTAALAALNINKVLVIGGPGAVSDAVVTQLASYNPTRLGGADQYATSQAVVTESVKRGLPVNQVFLADGSKPIQGALLGAPSGRIGGLLVLTHGITPSEALTVVQNAGVTTQPDRAITGTVQ